MSMRISIIMIIIIIVIIVVIQVVALLLGQLGQRNQDARMPSSAGVWAAYSILYHSMFWDCVL